MPALAVWLPQIFVTLWVKSKIVSSLLVGNQLSQVKLAALVMPPNVAQGIMFSGFNCG